MRLGKFWSGIFIIAGSVSLVLGPGLWPTVVSIMLTLGWCGLDFYLSRHPR